MPREKPGVGFNEQDALGGPTDAEAETGPIRLQQWKLTLAYDGSSYHGWQVQPGLSTIQGALAQAIHHVTGELVLPQGSGRTDTGVHALAQVASFSLHVLIPQANLQRALNRALAPSIRVLAAERVKPNFHARHSARRKTYEYRIFPERQSPLQIVANVCPPFLAPYVWDYRHPLDFDRLERAAALVLGEHDFSSFAAVDPTLTERAASKQEVAPPVPTPSNIRIIDASSWSREDGLLLYRVTGSGFLHHMVRNLVGTFIEVGRGRLAPDEIGSILSAKDRAAAGPTAPARGLFLVKVDYGASEIG